VASKWVGAVVGTFKVGDGTKVGAPKFQPDKPHLTLKGQHFQINVVAMLRQVTPPKGRMYLAAKGYTYDIDSKVSISPGVLPKLIVKGGKPYRIVTPGRQVTGKPQLKLAAKTFRVNRSQSPRPGKAKLILKGGAITKAGKAGLVPTVPYTRILTPTAVADEGNLVPTPAYTGDLLVPTVEEFV